MRTRSSTETAPIPVRLLVARLMPMMVVAWTRTYSIVLPGIMESFDLSKGDAGRIVATIEGGSFLSLLVLGVIVERLGGARIVLIGLPTAGVCLLLMTSVTNVVAWTAVLVLLGSGMAWTANGINTLMASTGERRTVYLGILHSAFSGFSVIGPLVAGYVVAVADWQSYYRLIAAIAFVITALVLVVERRQPQQTIRAASSQDAERPLIALSRIALPCVGIFALTGIQGTLNTWSYLYVKDVYATTHQQATYAPTAYWTGLLIGRILMTMLGRRFTPRTLLIASSVVPTVSFMIDQATGRFPVALVSFFIAGIGVSGTYQLGTAWAAQLLPNNIGLASTAVMGVAWLGIGTWPWAAGVLIDSWSYTALIAVVLGGTLLALGAFTASRSGMPLHNEGASV